MTNTVHGPFAAINVVNGSTPANATWGNNVQTQADAALHGFNPDLIGAGFVLSGVTCAKDGTLANQLDIASGRAYVVLSDGTVGLIVVGTDNTHTTVTPSSTYHLYLQPDGTWYWSTSNTPAANSLHICDVTTDGSGNISTVTDQRVTGATLLSGMAGALTLPKLGGIGAQATAGGFGAPVIVASAYGVAVSATTNQTILTYTPSANGLYRISGAITKQNATSNQVTMQFSYTDPFSGVQGQGAFFQTAGNGGTFNVLSGGTGDQSLGAVTYSLIPITFHAKSGFAITVQYQDPSGTPNDNVSALIERLI